jgi:sugar phosphate isomerase/epimerase
VRRPADLDLAAIRARLAARGLALSSVGTGLSWVDDRLAFASDDAAVRRAAIDRVLEVIEAFSPERPLVIIGTIKGRVAEAKDRATAIDRIRSALRVCCRRARDHGMALTLEAVCRYEQDFLNTVGEVARFIDDVGADNLRAHVDTFHMNIEEESIEASIVRWRDSIGHVHIADSNRLHPGAGHIDFPSIIGALARCGYQGCLAMECLPLPDPVLAAERGFSHVSRVLASLQG